MNITGTRFGSIDYSEDELIRLPSGLVGFGHLREFLLIQHRDDSPFRWLQSVDEPGLAFLVTSPWEYEPTYEPMLADEDAQTLEVSEKTVTQVWTTVNLPNRDLTLMTLNLAAPIVINVEKQVGKQVLLEGQAYNMRHRVFREVESVPAKQAA
jgi:flagellar assembly factor FliW